MCMYVRYVCMWVCVCTCVYVGVFGGICVCKQVSIKNAVT